MTEREEVKRYLGRLGRLERIRKPHEKRMTSSIKYILPYHYSMDPNANVEDWEDERYDTTASEAVTMLADGMVGNVCPSTVKWFSHRAAKNEANDDPEVKKWLQEVDDRMTDAVNRSNFYDMAPTIFKHGIAMETVCCPVNVDPSTGSAVVSTLPPREVYVVNDAHGRVFAVYRRFKLSAEQAIELFKKAKDRLSLPLLRAAEKSPDDEFSFVSVYEQRLERDPEKQDAANMPWRGITFEDGGEKIIEDAGYRTIPVPTWRWEIRGRDAYGYGLATEAMADIKTANEMARTLIVVAQKLADPPTFLPNEFMDDRDVSLEAGAINFYRDPGMRPYTHLASQGFPVNEKVLDSYREKIRSVFKVRYFMMLMQMEQPGRTAYEIRERKIEKITAMGSIIGRCQQELLIPILARMFWIEYEAGRLPEPPPMMRGEGLVIDFVGPFAQAQKEVTQTAGVLTGLNNLAGLFQIWPRLTMKINEEAVAEEILNSAGFPQKAMKTKKQYAKAVEAAQEAEQKQAEIAQAAELGKATKRVESGSIASQIMGTPEE